MILNIFTDGASRGNPGLAGAGVAIYHEGKLFDTISSYLGKKTNNEAEYLAVIRALEYIKERKLGVSRINLFADSQLVVKQLMGQYKVKAPTIIPLYKQVQELKGDIEMKFNWIRREENSVADELANKGIDER